MATKSSSEALKKLEEQLTCPICLEQFTNPKILPCFHSFCLHCLENVAPELVEGNLCLPCPTCRSPTCRPLEIFCETCEELICHNCTVKKHKDHDYDVVSDI